MDREVYALRRSLTFYRTNGDPLEYELPIGTLVTIHARDLDGDVRLRPLTAGDMISSSWVYPKLVRALSPLEQLALEAE